MVTCVYVLKPKWLHIQRFLKACIGNVKYKLLHIYLCTQMFEVISKSIKSRFQLTKTMFKSCYPRAVWIWFILRNFQDGTQIVYVTTDDNARLPRNKHFVLIYVDVKAITFFAEWCQTEQKWRQLMCTVHSKRLHCDFFRRLRQEFSSNYIQCKNNDHTSLFHYINVAGSLMKKHVWSQYYISLISFYDRRLTREIFWPLQQILIKVFKTWRKPRKKKKKKKKNKNRRKWH